MDVIKLEVGLPAQHFPRETEGQEKTSIRIACHLAEIWNLGHSQYETRLTPTRPQRSLSVYHLLQENDLEKIQSTRNIGLGSVASILQNGRPAMLDVYTERKWWVSL